MSNESEQQPILDESKQELPSDKPEEEHRPKQALLNNNHQLALLIDGENISPLLIKHIIELSGALGRVCLKRVYSGFCSPQWLESCREYSIQPVQTPQLTNSKNCTDIAMIIDAMDLMYTERFSGFCLASSDCDFTRLAQRLQEQCLFVYGFGEEKTPDAFQKACSRFFLLDNGRRDGSVMAHVADRQQQSCHHHSSSVGTLMAGILAAIENSADQEGKADEDGYVDLVFVGQILAKQGLKIPGWQKLSEFIEDNMKGTVELKFGYKKCWARIKEAAIETNTRVAEAEDDDI